MLFLEMQTQLARSWLQLAEESTRALTEACLSTSRETASALVTPPLAVAPLPTKTESVGLQTIGFGATNPFLALTPFFTPSQPSPSIWPSLPQTTPAWPFGAALPALPALPGLMPNMFSNPWMTSTPPVSPWFANMFSGSLWGRTPWTGGNPWSANPWSANPWAANLWAPSPWSMAPWMGQSPFTQNPFAQNLFTQNPWMNLWQLPKFDLTQFGLQRPNAGTPGTAMVDAWVSSYRTATGHAAAAILAPLQIEKKKPEPMPAAWWMWPIASTNKPH